MEQNFPEDAIKKPCHHSRSIPPLRMGAYFGGCSSLPRQQWQYQHHVKIMGLYSTTVRQEHQQWGEKDNSCKRGGGMIPSQWQSSSLPTQAGNGADPKAMQVWQWVKCRFSFYCNGGVSKKEVKTFNLLYDESTCVYFTWFLYSFSSQMACSLTEKPQQGLVYIATYPYRSGWCIKGAWVLP